MTDEHEIQQRIRYLIEHGGVYPQERVGWPVWAWVLIGLSVARLLFDLLH